MERVAKSCKCCWNFQKIRQNLQKLTRSTLKIVEISLDLLKSHRISPYMVEISLGSPWILLDLTKYGQDLTESPWIWAWSCWSWLDLYITLVGSGGFGFGEENPPLDSLASGLRRRNLSLTDGSIGLSWNRVGIGRVGRSNGSRSGLDTTIYIYIYNIVIFEGNIHKSSCSVRCKNIEKYVPKKKKITQDNIYTVRQFIYVHRVAEISLFSMKNTRCGSTVFSLKTT